MKQVLASVPKTLSKEKQPERNVDGSKGTLQNKEQIIK